MSRVFTKPRILVAGSALALVIAGGAYALIDWNGDSATETGAVAGASQGGTPAPNAADDGPIAGASSSDKADCTTTSGKEDVAGVKVGMSEAEVKKVLDCTNANYQFGRQVSLINREGGSIQRITLAAATGLDGVVVILGGRAGAERVWGAVRTLEFTDSTRPTADAVRNSLREKYGELDFFEKVTLDWNTKIESGVADSNLPRIVTAADNQKINWKSSIYNRCASTPSFFNSNDTPNANDRVCGFVMLSVIKPLDDNPNMVKYVVTTIFNPRDAGNLYLEDLAALKVEGEKKSAELNEKKEMEAKEAEALGDKNAPKL